MNSQPAWWKSGRWNNPALLSRVVSGKRRFSIFSRRTGKTRRGVSEGFFSHPFAFLLPTLIRRYFRLSRKGNSLITPATFQNRDTAALTASFRFYRCGSSPPYPAKPIREGPLLGKLHLHMRAASKNTPTRLSFAKVYESPAFIRAIPPGLQSRQTSKLIMKPINKQYIHLSGQR